MSTRESLLPGISLRMPKPTIRETPYNILAESVHPGSGLTDAAPTILGLRMTRGMFLVLLDTSRFSAILLVYTNVSG